MSHDSDRYLNIRFQAAPSRTGSALPVVEQWLRPLRQVPSSSIFARSERPHAPVISPADRLLIDEVFRRAQLSAGAYRPTALARRIQACLRALGARSPAEALRQLELHPASLEAAVNALLIGVTSFFRDTPVFNHLRHTALPDLLRASAAPRVLSVGCSDGAELYSLAMLLGEAGAKGEFRGIDCRRRAIERARAGRYPHSSLAAVPEPLRSRYFTCLGTEAEVKEALRGACQFSVGDAFLHVLAPPYDLIACRNFSIYLEHPAAARLWRRLQSALRPGGLLLVG